MKIKPGTTSKLKNIFIGDSSSTTGAGKTGLLHSSSGLKFYYIREGAATAVSVTPVTMTVGTWVSGGFKEIDATNMPGWYQIGIPDAALASGADSVGIALSGVADMAPVNIEVELNIDSNIISTSISAVSITTGITSGTITQHRGDDWSFSITGLGGITGNTKVWFTAKKGTGHKDESALIQIEKTGLLYINGSSGTAANATLTVDDESAGDITITVKAEETAKLDEIETGRYDVQWKNAAGEIKTLSSGAFILTEDVSRATS